MGNCFGSSAVNNHSPNATKPPTPETSRKNSSRSNKNNITACAEPGTNNNNSNNNNNSSSSSQAAMPPSGKIITPNLKMFTLAELKIATRNFRPDTMLGEGGFGRVFKGWIDEKTLAPSKVGVGIAVAVKKSNPDSLQGLEEWQWLGCYNLDLKNAPPKRHLDVHADIFSFKQIESEVKFLGKFSHPNLVKLLGYCWEDKQFLLVYEYMQKGSLEQHLFRKGGETLAWDIRLKIAIGAAQGLAFLHTSEKSVIYRDFKTSNILLDEAYNAKLSDFGLAKLGPANGNSHVTTRVMGTYGYAAPEYVATGHLYVKSDVFGFGVVLLEMLTGLRAFDSNRPTGQQTLVDWAKPSLSRKRKLKKIMDPGLAGQYPITGAMQASDLILHCLENDPKRRPSMEEILDTLQKINSIQEKPKESRSSKTKNRAATHREERSPRQHHSDNPRRSPLHSKPPGSLNNGARARTCPATARWV